MSSLFWLSILVWLLFIAGVFWWLFRQPPPQEDPLDLDDPKDYH